ncbi:MAG TPA: cell surface protein SprA [Bacteroidales bacterium]|nr:cell surface protein SprA [Bacteroidales bacterium]
MKTVKYEESGIKLRPNLSKSINHKLKTESVTVKAYTDKGVEIKVKMDVKSPDRITIKAENELDNVKVVVEGKVPEKINPFKVIAESSIRVLMGLKSVSVSLSDNRGTVLPGYKPNTKYIGMNDVNGVYAPGLAFVSGWQDPEFAWYAINHGWLTKDTTFNDAFRLTYSENITLRALYEPMPNFKVEINAIRTYSRNKDQNYRANEFGQYRTTVPVINGNYSLSIISAGSAFKSPKKVFNRFKSSRYTVAKRLFDQRDKKALRVYEWGPNKFPTGYSELSQEVLIPSFLSAYSQYSSSNVPLDNFPRIPMPNWQITYDGLAKLSFFKNYFRTFTLTHGYRSVYSIGAYAANLKYDEEEDGLNWVTNSIGDFITRRDITNVSIIEQFSPLIGLDMNWVNNLTSRFEVKTSRSLAMSFSNNQLTQTNAWEYIIGGGYRFENMPLIFGSEEGQQRTLKSDLRLRLDFSIRKNETVLHKMVEEVSITNAGMITTSIKASADYLISNQVTFRAFFDWGKTKPTASGPSFPQINSSFGFSLRFTMI